MPGGIGQKIMQRRIKRGMSREVLANLVGRSGEWLRQVESGARRLDSIQVAAQLGEVLGDDLYLAIVQRPQNGQVRKLTTGLLSADLRAELICPDWMSGPANKIVNLDAAVDGLQQLWWYSPGRVVEIADGLADLVKHARRNRFRAPDDVDNIDWSVDALNLARSFLSFTGDRILAVALAERSVIIADRRAPLSAAVATRGLARAYLGTNQLEAAESLAIATAERLDDRWPVIRGSLYSIAAVAASRRREPGVARAMTAAAGDIANALKRSQHLRGVWFGASELALTEMSVAHANGSYADVLALAKAWEPGASTPAQLRIRFHALVAKLCADRDDVGTAVLHLREIEDLFPEAFVYSSMIHRTLHRLNSAEHRLLGSEIRRMCATAAQTVHRANLVPAGTT